MDGITKKEKIPFKKMLKMLGRLRKYGFFHFHSHFISHPIYASLIAHYDSRQAISDHFNNIYLQDQVCVVTVCIYKPGSIICSF